MNRETFMVQKKRRRARKSKARRSSSSKAGSFKFPKAFRIVPIRVKARARKSARLLGAESSDPCPPPYVFSKKVMIGGQWYCVCINASSETIMILCPPSTTT
jgi:hypothetical protein